MAALRLVPLSLFIALIFSQSRAYAPAGEGELEVGGYDDSSSLKIELDRLNSRIHAFESILDERTKDLKSKDDIISRKEKIIQEKFNRIASLQNEIASLQKNGKMDVAEQVGKAHARAGELENQVDKLKKEVEMQDGKKLALKARIGDAEKKMRGLNLKLQNLQKTNDEQESMIHKTERALQIAEEEMMKAKLEAISKTRELMKVHGAWLPAWLVVHFLHCQSFMEREWTEHGRPVMNIILQKTLEKKAQAQKWTKAHIETFKVKWVPAMKEQLVVMTAIVEPHVQSLKTKAVELYKASKSAVTPHIVTAREIADPYIQEAKKVKPYIDQVATVTKPHVDKVRLVLKPYNKKVVRAYRKFLKSATMYHNQAQDSIRGLLKQHELTRSLATKELVWFVASALLALPFIFSFRAFSAVFGKKAKKRARNANSTTNHARRRAKRVHPDK